MPSSELIDYIRSQTQEGASLATIRADLVAAGWPSNDVDDGVHAVASDLHPLTPGASIHEDLAQVRGVVAYLSARLKTAEDTVARLTAATTHNALGMQSSLPSSWIGPERELGAPHRGSILRAFASLLALCLGIGSVTYGVQLVQREIVYRSDFSIILGACVLFSGIAAVFVARRGSGYLSRALSLLTISLGLTYVYFLWASFTVVGIRGALAAMALSLSYALWMHRMSKRYEE
ncbi:MAG: hypothetical protein KBC02_02380 [Candidatus Pacebacteria bacterium]|nr:hypothetical protein [Candidatus Paceibacterota bacterium]